MSVVVMVISSAGQLISNDAILLIRCLGDVVNSLMNLAAVSTGRNGMRRYNNHNHLHQLVIY